MLGWCLRFPYVSRLCRLLPWWWSICPHVVFFCELCERHFDYVFQRHAVFFCPFISCSTATACNVGGLTPSRRDWTAVVHLYNGTPAGTAKLLCTCFPRRSCALSRYEKYCKQQSTAEGRINVIRVLVARNRKVERSGEQTKQTKQNPTLLYLTLVLSRLLRPHAISVLCTVVYTATAVFTRQKYEHTALAVVHTETNKGLAVHTETKV